MTRYRAECRDETGEKYRSNVGENPVMYLENFTQND